MSRTTATTSRDATHGPARLRAMLDDHVRFVTRTLKKAGVPASELDDQVQQTFMVAARRLNDVQLGAERPFLHQVALNMAAHVRRKLARRREVLEDKVPEHIESHATPEQLTSRKEIQALIRNVAARMTPSLYEVFSLFAFEGANLNQIATRLNIRRGTVASRLRRARAQFREHATEIDIAWDLGTGAKRLEDPQVMSREKLSKLMQALLGAGALPGASPATRMETLAVLGLAGRAT